MSCGLLASRLSHRNQIQDKATEHLLLRCVRWDNPDVYYALDALLHHYAYQLTAKPGPIKGTTILGIKRLPELNHQATQPQSTVNGNATAHAQEGTTA